MEQRIKSTNRMSAKQLVISENASLDFIQNPKTGKIFFTCGKKQGYVSPKAQEALASGATINDFQYAEVSIDDKPAVPCLMVVGRSNQNVKYSFGEDLLH